MIDACFEPDSNDTGAFSERDRAVLRVIGEEKLLSFTFEGLRRRTGTHSETLSRIISRLEKGDILARTDGGYVVTERGREISMPYHSVAGEPGTTILQTVLPPVRDTRLVVSGLMGRWFGNLRWFGHSAANGTTILKWVTGDGRVQLDAVFDGLRLTIKGRAGAGADTSEAIEASHRLVGYISKLYAARHGRSSDYIPPGPTGEN